MEVSKAIKEAVKTAEEACQENKDDSYSSYVYAHKKQKLTEILSRLDTYSYMELVLNELKQERLHLLQLIGEEEFHPTFDWYAEHYFEAVYAGELAGCEEVISLLEPYLQNTEIHNSPQT